jgi:hypothetical protein
VLKEIFKTIMDPYMQRIDKLKTLEEIIIVIKNMGISDNVESFAQEVETNMFRNKNKKVDEVWDLEYILTRFEEMRDTNALY